MQQSLQAAQQQAQLTGDAAVQAAAAGMSSLDELRLAANVRWLPVRGGGGQLQWGRKATHAGGLGTALSV